jgi:hypothetical protein
MDQQLTFLTSSGRGLQRFWRDMILFWLNPFFSRGVSREMTQSMFLFGTILTASQQGLFTSTLASKCLMNNLHRARISLFCVAVHVGNFPITGRCRKTMAHAITKSRIFSVPRIMISRWCLATLCSNRVYCCINRKHVIGNNLINNYSPKHPHSGDGYC